MTRDWKHPLGCAALLALTAGCVTPLLPEQSTERESTVVAALQPNHVTIDGPLGPVVLPRACLEPVEPSVAAYSPRTSPGCALGLAMDRHLANPNDRVQPRRPGLPLSQPLANSQTPISAPAIQAAVAEPSSTRLRTGMAALQVQQRSSAQSNQIVRD